MIDFSLFRLYLLNMFWNLLFTIGSTFRMILIMLLYISWSLIYWEIWERLETSRIGGSISIILLQMIFSPFLLGFAGESTMDWWSKGKSNVFKHLVQTWVDMEGAAWTFDFLRSRRALKYSKQLCLKNLLEQQGGCLQNVLFADIDMMVWQFMYGRSYHDK